MPLRPVRRFFATFAAALAIHVALVSVVLVAAPHKPAEPASHEGPDPATEMFDIAVDEGRLTAEEPSPASTPVSLVGMTERREASARAAAAPTMAVEEGAAGDPPASSVAADGFSLRTTAIDLRLAPGAGALGAERAAAEGPGLSTPPPVSTTGGLVEALDAKDVERGLGRGGPVRSAVDEAAHTADAPALGVALFAVSIDRGGRIMVDVLDASVERTKWEGLRPLVEERLAQKALKLPPARGLRVTVRVEATVEFPGGVKPTPPEKTGAFIKATPPKIVETKDHIELVPPAVAFGIRGRKCGVGIAISPGAIGASAGCAVGVAMRVVHTRIVSEERL